MARHSGKRLVQSQIKQGKGWVIPAFIFGLYLRLRIICKNASEIILRKNEKKT
jgi:hypothetical protein